MPNAYKLTHAYSSQKQPDNSDEILQTKVKLGKCLKEECYSEHITNNSPYNILQNHSYFQSYYQKWYLWDPKKNALTILVKTIILLTKSCFFFK